MDPMPIMLFISASLLVILTPGQDMLLVMSRAVSQGPRAGVITACGVSIGLLGHSVLATLGLGAVLLASASLFTLLKLFGACYLVYLGGRLWLGNSNRLDLETTPDACANRLFLSGAISNISNPHVTVFYVAFLPQFIPVDVEHPAFYVLLLGLSFAALTFLVKGPIGYGAGRVSGRLRSQPALLRWIDRLSGAMLIGLGIRLAFHPML